MKRALMIMFLVVPISVFATDMCARDDTMVMVFDKNVLGESHSHNSAEFAWYAKMPYGQIAGDATCLSAIEGLGRTAGLGVYYGVGEYANTRIDVEPGLSGVDIDGNKRIYCWCRMTHPVVSGWVFFEKQDSCKGMCANTCAYRAIVKEHSIRGGLFESVAQY